MIFPEHYFEDEIRDGFYVPGIMKAAWAASIELYLIFDEICKKHNIEYMVDFGTLLGAVRHKGFVPWDDDMDVMMTRDNLKKFKAAAPSELPDGHIMIDYTGDNPYGWDYVTRIASSESRVCFDSDYMERYHGFPIMVNLDIFCYDYLKEDEGEFETIANIAGLGQQIVEYYAHNPETIVNEDNLEACITAYEQFTGVNIRRDADVRLRISTVNDSLFGLYKEEESKYLAIITQILKIGNRYKYLKEWYGGIVYLPFEMLQMPVPCQYKKILEIKYASGYMNKILAGGSHGYPFFDSILQKMREMPEDFSFLKKCEYDEKTMTPRLLRETADGKRRVLFITNDASKWSYFEKYYRSYMNDAGTEITVLAIPYYEKDISGKILRKYYEKGEYPEGINIVDYKEYDIEKEHPNVIFIQNPYDYMNYRITTDGQYYASIIREFTDKLVYVQSFELNETWLEAEKMKKNMDYYITVPGVMYADEVIAGSEAMRRAYIEKLTEYAGEESRQIWEAKIKS